MSARRKPKTNPSRAELAKQRQALLELKSQTEDKVVRRMIDLAIQGLDAGVPRLTPEEIYAELGRGHG